MVRKKDIDAIKEQLKKEKRERKKEIRPDVTFMNSLGALCLTYNMHCGTIYKLVKIKHMDQMLETMREAVIKEYNLHKETLDKLVEQPLLRKELEERLEQDYKKRIRIPV